MTDKQKVKDLEERLARMTKRVIDLNAEAVALNEANKELEERIERLEREMVAATAHIN